MPPSGRKGKNNRGRKGPAAEQQELSDAETPEAIATPTRSSRKRTRAADAPAPASRQTRRKVKDTRNAEREDTEGTEAQDHSDAETEPAPPTEQEIISHLRIADRQVNATEDFANDLLEGQEHVPGYGKIAGRDWTFIMRKVEINIGRPEAQERLTVGENGQSGPSSRTVVDIDLGPDRQVSRSHAIISYDPDSMGWFIVVNGRNGLRVDNNLLKRGMKTYLRNGNVIEIANTQMAFITTVSAEGDVPIWDASIIRQTQKSSEEDDDGEDDSRSNGHHAFGQPPARSTLHGMHRNDFGGGEQQHRSHPHSQYAAPDTPTRTQTSFAKSSPAANYARGVMMESTESIDYSAENAKDLKPPHSYAQMIGMAILSTPEQQMTLSNIYKWIMANYAFYRFNTGGWQNSIRHNLSLNKAFTKIARRTDEPGKGMKWMIEPTEFDNFVQQGMKGCRRPNPMPGTQSTFGSPTSPMSKSRLGPNGIKRDEEVTPPLSAYRPPFPTAVEAYTPDRGPKRQPDTTTGLGIHSDGHEYDFLTRSTPRNGLTAHAAGSPPSFYVSEEGRIGLPDTPFPLRPSQRLAPPSTLKRPSDFIQFSSPAPFWKMEGLTGSTPFKPYDLSPLKTPFSSFKKSEAETKETEAEDDSSPKEDEGTGSEEGGEPKPKGSPIIHSSSPPRPNSSSIVLDASPSASRPATAVAKTLSQLAAANKEPATREQNVADAAASATPPPNKASGTSTQTLHETAPASSAAASQAAGIPAASGYLVSNNNNSNTTTAMAHASAYPYINAPPATGYHNDDTDEDAGIDLAKGFQPIGAFHQRNHLTMSLGMAPVPAAAPARASAYGR